MVLLLQMSSNQHNGYSWFCNPRKSFRKSGSNSRRQYIKHESTAFGKDAPATLPPLWRKWLWKSCLRWRYGISTHLFCTAQQDHQGYATKELHKWINKMKSAASYYRLKTALLRDCVCACVRACVCVWACACMRVFVCACVSLYVCAGVQDMHRKMPGKMDAILDTQGLVLDPFAFQNLRIPFPAVTLAFEEMRTPYGSGREIRKCVPTKRNREMNDAFQEHIYHRVYQTISAK